MIIIQGFAPVCSKCMQLILSSLRRREWPLLKQCLLSGFNRSPHWLGYARVARWSHVSKPLPDITESGFNPSPRIAGQPTWIITSSWSNSKPHQQVTSQIHVWKQISALKYNWLHKWGCATWSHSLVLTKVITLQKIKINLYTSGALWRLLTFYCSASNEMKIINNCSHLSVTNVI